MLWYQTQMDQYTFGHGIYIRTVSSKCLVSNLLIQFKLVYVPFGQSKMHLMLDFCPRPARKERNVPLYKRPIAFPSFTSLLRFSHINLTENKFELHSGQKCLPWVASFWCKMPMFQRAGMKEGGSTLSPGFQ